MEELTAKLAEERAEKAAIFLIQHIEALNQNYAGQDPIWPPASARPLLTAVFVRLLSDRYIIVPSKS
jgi:hypothetical protein